MGFRLGLGVGAIAIRVGPKPLLVLEVKELQGVSAVEVAVPILKDGEDVLILAIGRPVCEALSAHSSLMNDGITAAVINCRFVKPLDVDLIISFAEKVPRIITIEENMLQGGFGSAVLECLIDNGITGFRLERIGIPDTFIEHGSQDLLRSKYGIDTPAIIKAAKRLMLDA